MSGLAELFAGSNFQNTIQTYCAQQQWRITELNDKIAVLRFNTESGGNQTCFITKYDSTLEFSVPSGFHFASRDDVPHYISTLLLKRSSESKIGFWCIEEIASKQVYSCMHNAELQLIDGPYFAKVVRALVNECDEFETLVRNSN